MDNRRTPKARARRLADVLFVCTASIVLVLLVAYILFGRAVGT